jgi:pyruvate/2-oxoglutarate dehydrogenase complex dihydrolipoamide acyltransferase (E2) component
MFDIPAILEKLLDRAIEEYGDETLRHHIETALDTAVGLDVDVDFDIEVDVGEILQCIKDLVEGETPSNANTVVHLAQASARVAELPPPTPKVNASPGALALSGELGLDLVEAEIEGTGTDGKVLKRDVETYLANM